MANETCIICFVRLLLTISIHLSIICFTVKKIHFIHRGNDNKLKMEKKKETHTHTHRMKETPNCVSKTET